MSTRLIVAAAVGIVVGVATWNPYYGAQAFSVTYALGARLDPNGKAQGPRLEDLRAPGAAPGTPLNWVQGHVRTGGFCAWASDKREIATTTEQGGKGAPGVDVTEFSYEVDILYVVADNQIDGVRRIWRNGELIWSIADDADAETLAASQTTDAWRYIRVYAGSPTEMPDPVYEAAVGMGNAPGYRGRGTVFIEGLQLLQGGQLPLLEFEVVTKASLASVDTRLLYNFAGPNDADLTIYSHDLSYGVEAAAGPDGLVSSGTGTSHAYTDYHDTLVLGDTWTIQCYVTVGPQDNAYPTIFSLVQQDAAQPNGWRELHVRYDVSGHSLPDKFQLFVDDIMLPGTNTYPPGKHHICVMCNESGTALWVDGARETNYTNAVMLADAPARMIFFAQPSLEGIGDASFEGSISSFKTTKDAALFGETFTPPGDPLLLDATTLTAEPEVLPDVITRLCVRAGLQASDVDATALAGLYVHGLGVPGGTTVRQTLDILRAAFFLECRESDKMYFIRRGLAPVATLTWDELGASNDPMQPADALPMHRANDDEMPAAWTVRYANALADYQGGSETGDRLITNSTAIQVLDVPLVMPPTEAKALASALAIDAHVALTTAEIALTQQRAALEPADVILVPDEQETLWRMRIGRIEDGSGIRKASLVLDDATVLSQLGITDTSYPSSSAVRPLGDTLIEPLDIPMLRDADNNPGFYVAAKGTVENWRGGAVMESLDDVSFTRAALVSEPAVMGTATTALGDWTGGWMFDEANSVTVNVGLGTLASYSRDAIINGTAPGALVGDEIIHWRTATLVSAGVYTLSGLLRGRRGTEWAQGSHVAGERFVVIQTTGLRRVVRDSGQLGVPYYLRGVTRGRALDSADSEVFTDQGVALKPFAPVDIRAARNGAGDVTLTWTRRTRLSTRLTGSAGINAPLGEASEAYDVLIYASSAYASVVRTISATSATVTYSAADQTTDLGGPQATLYVGIAQRSAVIGRGTEARKAA